MYSWNMLYVSGSKKWLSPSYDFALDGEEIVKN